MEEIIVSESNYYFIKWNQLDEIDIMKLLINNNWKKFKKNVDCSKLNEMLTKESKKSIIVPPPHLVFYSLNRLSPKEIKVVIIGQDPYPNGIEAQGASFSVPYGVNIPSSLMNVYRNLVRFKHMTQMPNHGCLVPWIIQGVFLINAAFTTRQNEKNVHQKDWKDFTEKLIAYLNDTCDNLVFLVWGSFAHDRVSNVDKNKHYLSISSHCSGLSVSKGYQSYPAFCKADHFGKTNLKLEEWGKLPIKWDSLDLINEIMKD